MTEHSHRFALFQRIIGLSEADQWEKAKLEWRLETIHFTEDGEFETCLCGHYPIHEVCRLRNQVNGLDVDVGNVCVTKFMGINSKLIFDGIKRVAEDNSKALNDAAIDHAFKRGWVNAKEYTFLHDTNRKRSLSAAQMKWRQDINRRVLARMRKRAQRT